MNGAAETIYGVKSTAQNEETMGKSQQQWFDTVGSHKQGNSAKLDLMGLFGRAVADDQFVSLVLGGLGMLLLLRRFFVYLALLLTSSYLLYRGLGYQALWPGNRQEDRDRERTGAGRRGIRQASSADLSHDFTYQSDQGLEPRARPPMEPADQDGSQGDEVDEALRETFPASDPPATW